MPTMDRSTSLRIKGRNLSHGGGGGRRMGWGEDAARKTHTWPELLQPLLLDSGAILNCSSHPPLRV